MEYYFNKVVSSGFGEAIAKATEAMKKEGFGIVSEIDMQAKFKEKLNVDFRKYKILGACNPGFAYKAVKTEEKIGTMLPCNFLFIDKEDGTIEISAINPIASMMAIQNENLKPLAEEVTDKLKRIISILK